VTVAENVRTHYARVAVRGGASSCCSVYSDAESALVPPGADLGLGTGSPVRAADPQPGETLVDLGSGSGADVFLAARAVGPAGRAVGVDFTPEMVARSRRLAEEHGYGNVRFVEGSIEDVPLPDATVDVVVSNCVVNLAERKDRVLQEAFRLLVPGGRLAISDTLRPEGDAAPAEITCDCMGGAMTAAEWARRLADAGFADINVEPSGARTVLVRARKPR
jgi:SAM-dependent methyltransferase